MKANDASAAAPQELLSRGAAPTVGATGRQQCLFAAVCLAIPLLFTAGYVAKVMPVGRGELVDSDCYMRLLRVEKLWQTGRWFDPVSERSNAPYGEALHWTRPFDVLLLLGAAPASAFVDFRTALFWWGVALSPLLLFGLFFCFPWVTRPLLQRDGPQLATLLLICQLAVFGAFEPGRPDHHGLLILLFVLSVGFTLRLVQGPLNVPLCYGAAAISALAIWASIEGMFGVLLAFLVLGVLWIWHGGDYTDKCFYYSAATFALLCVALLIERPWRDWAAVELDRLSLVHGCLFGLIALVFAVLRVVARRTGVLAQRRNRLWAGCVGAAVALATMAVLFPRFYRGPWADVDPRVVSVYLTKVMEARPLLWPDVSWTLAVPVFGAALIGVPLLVRRSLGGPQRAAWAFVLLTTAFYGALCILQVRWGPYVQVLLLLPFGELLAQVWIKLGRWEHPARRALAKGLIMVGCVYFFVFLGLQIALALDRKDPKKEEPKHDYLIPVCQYLDTAAPWRDRPARLLAPIFWGGEILYRTHHEIISSCYHRNAAGILDAYDTLAAPTDEEALRLIRRRGIDLLLLKAKPDKTDPPDDGAEPATFGRRLREGRLPSWCRRVDLANDLAAFLLFEIVSDRSVLARPPAPGGS